MVTRRALIAMLAAAAADPDRLLWRPGAKHYSIPKPAVYEFADVEALRILNVALDFWIKQPQELEKLCIAAFHGDPVRITRKLLHYIGLEPVPLPGSQHGVTLIRTSGPMRVADLSRVNHRSLRVYGNALIPDDYVPSHGRKLNVKDPVAYAREIIDLDARLAAALA